MKSPRGVSGVMNSTGSEAGFHGRTEVSTLLALVGPTASGKTEASLQLADRLDAELVYADSMTVYIGMDVGTTKPRSVQRRRAPHHLIDVVSPASEFSVSEFQVRARVAIDDIRSRRKVPLVVSGSGLYYRAILDDLQFPPTDSVMRTKLEREAAELGSQELHRRLGKLD